MIELTVYAEDLKAGDVLNEDMGSWGGPGSVFIDPKVENHGLWSTTRRANGTVSDTYRVDLDRRIKIFRETWDRDGLLRKALRASEGTCATADQVREFTLKVLATTWPTTPADVAKKIIADVATTIATNGQQDELRQILQTEGFVDPPTVRKLTVTVNIDMKFGANSAGLTSYDQQGPTGSAHSNTADAIVAAIEGNFDLRLRPDVKPTNVKVTSITTR